MKRLLLALAVAGAFWSAACSGNGIVNPPPPVGKYTKASLNGQYAFVTNGESFTGGLSATPLARTGSFTADGLGNITTGVEDINAAGTVSTALQITGGSYTVNADGRGTLTLQLGQNSIDFGITLTSTSDGLMIDETSNSAQSSTGSGNFIKQTPGSFQVSGIAGPYVFDFSGLDGNQTLQCPCPESFIGEFTANNGAVSAGFFDDNDNGSFNGASFAGTIAQDPLQAATLSSFGRGVALIAGQNYVFYIVDATRVRFISTNGGMLSGDAVAQSNTAPANVSSIASSFVFIVAGSSINGGITRVGRFTANGATVTNVLEDTNDAGHFIKTDSGTNASIRPRDSHVHGSKLPQRSWQIRFLFEFCDPGRHSGTDHEQQRRCRRRRRHHRCPIRQPLLQQQHFWNLRPELERAEPPKWRVVCSSG